MTAAKEDAVAEADVASLGHAYTMWAAGEVRAHMARAGVRASTLARALGVSHRWVSARLHGKVPMTTADLACIAAVCGLLDPRDLFAGGTYPPRRDDPTGAVNEPTSSATSARNRAAGRWFSQVTGDVAERDADLLPTG